ncbi:MAG: type I 3-dehydroquinate dehydratase [Luteolibacter sp.]
MISNSLRFETGTPLTVGSFGDGEALRGAAAGPVLAACDLVEIRLDVLAAGGVEPNRRLWAHLEGIPILFTARRREEGGALDSTAAERLGWLKTALEDAAAIDIEVASLSDYPDLLEILSGRNIPLVASFHDFEATPATPELLDRLETARAAGAAVFKAAARVHTPADVAALADFQRTDHGLPKALMGMGPLAPVSRLLCAQYGSVLNYGYLGKTPTAPGQWSAARLKDAISNVAQA